MLAELCCQSTNSHLTAVSAAQLTMNDLTRHISSLGSGNLLLPPANLCTCPETWSGESIGSILPVCTTLQASRQNA